MTERIAYQDHDPKLMEGMNRTEAYVKKSSVDLKLLELVKYRVSQINGCAFCLDMHHKEALHLRETELRLHSLAAWRECPFYSEQERVVLAFAEALTLASTRDIDDELYSSLSAFYSKQEIAVITLAITNINAWNRINKVFRHEPGKYVVGQFG